MSVENEEQDRDAQRKDEFDRTKSDINESSARVNKLEVLSSPVEVAKTAAWRKFDLFMFGFTTITSFTFVGTALALLAVLVLDVRWLLGHVSSKVPPMAIYSAMFLGVLNLIVFIFSLLVFVLGFLVVCAAINPAGLTVRTIGLALGFDTELLNACY